MNLGSPAPRQEGERENRRNGKLSILRMHGVRGGGAVERTSQSTDKIKFDNNYEDQTMQDLLTLYHS